MNWEEVYKKETGNNAGYTKTDEWNAFRTHDWYYDDYVIWLENKLTAASQPVVESGRATSGSNQTRGYMKAVKGTLTGRK